MDRPQGTAHPAGRICRRWLIIPDPTPHRVEREASESYPQAMNRPENIFRRPAQAAEGRRVKYVSQPTTSPCSYPQRILRSRFHPTPTNLASPATSHPINFREAIALSNRSEIILKLIAASRWPKPRLIAKHIGTTTCLKCARINSRPYRSLFGKYWVKTQSRCVSPFIRLPYRLRESRLQKRSARPKVVLGAPSLSV